MQLSDEVAAPPQARQRKRWRPRPRLRTILLLINLVILALPLGGIIWLRLYESALVRQTESELVAQGVFIAAAYQQAVQRAAAPRPALRTARERREAPAPPPLDLASYGLALPETAAQHAEGQWRPRPAVLDLATDPIHPTPSDPAPTAQAPDTLAGQIGQELTPTLRLAQRVTLAGIRVVDFRGVIVASTSEDFGLTLIGHEEVQRALAGESVSRMRWRTSGAPTPPLDSISRGTRIRVSVAVPIVREQRVLGAVLLVRTPANIKQAVYGKRWPLLYAGLILVAVVALLSLFTSLTISRPVQNLIAQARRAARGERGAVTPLAHPATREIAELSEDVAAMARTLEERAGYIRSFAAHVSHEFKTPLTAIQGAVELLREHADTMSPEERSRFLGILASDAHRLENLVRRLLELARADVMQAGPGERAELGAVLPATARRYRERGMPVELPPDPPAALVAMAPETLDSIVSNLLDNARQHAGAAAGVRLDWAVEGAQARITVSDEGPGISPANAARIFEPFFTTARKTGNTGLGLPIIRALLQAHGGRIELLSPPRGAAFRITLPLAAR